MKSLVVILFFLFSSFLVAQSDIVKDNKSKEIPLKLRLEQHFEECERKVDSLCKATGLEKSGYFKDGVAYRIVDVTPNGFPVIEIDENSTSAESISTDLVYPENGIYNLTGSSMTIGIWEVGGIPLPTHQELTGKIYVGDGEASSSQHATHVGGTMVARGVDIRARGMAYDGSLKAYNTTSD